PAHQTLGEKAGEKPTHEEFREAVVHFGEKYLSQTPAAIDHYAARRYVEAAWERLPNEDKAKIVEHLRRLQWVPYGERERKDVFSHARGRARSWSNWVRRELKKKEPTVKPEVARQIAPVEKAFRKALDPDAVDPNQAPNRLCKAFARALVAEQLDKLGNREPDEHLRFICDTVVRCKHGRGWWRTTRGARERTLELNAVFEKALLARLKRKRFSPTLFEWFRGTRRGDHWRAQGGGEEVMARMIETRALHKSDYRPYDEVPSATVSYMRLIREEFPELRDQYPLESAFDEMFVEEARTTGYLDWEYWDYGVDEEKKVVNAAAELLQRHQALPFDCNGEEVTYARSDFWNWQTRALGAEAAARDRLIAQAEKAYGKTRFDTFAMGRAYFSAQADASTPKGRAEFFERLRAYLDRVRKAPVRLPPPYLGQLDKLDDQTELSKEELDILLSIFPDGTPTRWPHRWHFDTLVEVVVEGLLGQKRELELYGLVPHFWKIARDTGSTDLQRELTGLAVDLSGRERHDLALVCSTVGLEMVRADLPDDARSSLVAARSKSLSSIGAVIPVKRSDPRYPIYAAQAAFLGGRYDQAVQRLEKLARSKDSRLQAESYYGVAQVRFDQEEYREALDDLDQVFARVPDHADAKILEARTKVKLRKLEEPTEVQIGTVTRRRFIVPGKPLKVGLEDRNLAIVGTSTDIEIRAWAGSGDEERFSLMPFGDSKTTFRGSLPTALAPPAKGDRTLQVLGDDMVHYDFSERFKAEHKIPLGAPATLRVTTDAELLVSSGRVLTEAEREARALDRLIRQRLGQEDEQARENTPPTTLEAFQTYLGEGHVRDGCARFTREAAALADKLDYNVKGLAGEMKLAGEREGSWYLVHHYAAFYQPVRRIRTFDVQAKGLDIEGGERARTDPVFLLTVDGEPGDGPTQVRRSLGKGAHRIDLYIGATRKHGPEYTVRMDTAEAPFTKTCPPATFDGEKHPQIRAGVYREPAEVTAGQDGGRFEIAFPDGARARVVRLFIREFETDAPGINKIALTSADGKTVLPTQEDFMDLRTNDVPEIIPGDRVTVSYEDSRVITQGRQHHEAFLTATFSNATISACFVEYTVDGAGDREAQYIPMRRFKPGDKINVFINDPDCDVSDEQDTVTFQARTSEGQATEFPALETAEHSGVFVGGIFPVTEEPERESELQVVEGDDVIVTYLDEENTDPGIPWNRACVVEQTWYEPPQVRVYSVASQPIDEDEGEARAELTAEEFVPVTRSLVVTWPEQPEAEERAQRGAAAGISGGGRARQPLCCRCPRRRAVYLLGPGGARRAAREVSGALGG
ncbi:MAG: tetratricopeptide repeat protein, partial [Planctomycetota bacterium]